MKKFKGIKVLLSTVAMMSAFTMNTYAGNWVQNSTGWWYDWGNGSWPSSSWQWIDGNSDGVAECYYFDRFGYCMVNTTTPDNYQVNSAGAWVEDGIIQTRDVGSGRTSSSTGINSTKKEQNYKSKKKGETQEQEETQEQKEETKKKKQYNGKYLYDMTPILSEYVYNYDSLITNKENKTFTRVIKSNWPGYAEYVADQKYSKLKATVAPVKDGTNSWEASDRMVLQVMGDGDELYVSKDIYYNTGMFDIEVDISGYDIIRLNFVNVEGTADVGVINARFE
jgi:cysteine-rich secretory protein family./putative cell wall binding repeat